MKNVKIGKIGAVVSILFLFGSILSLPMSGEINNENVNNLEKTQIVLYEDTNYDDAPGWLDDEIYIKTEDVSFAGEQNDIGYDKDAGDSIQRSVVIYVGEIVDNGPGRGRNGILDPDSGDSDDWYRFSVCEGQSIQVSLNSGEDFNFELADSSGITVGQSHTADVTGIYFLHIFANDGAGTDDYTFSVMFDSQNDAGTGNDAGDSIDTATSITPGSYSGYMEYNDQEDWYSFSANSGQGIFVTVEPMEKSDYDIHLYNPLGELVHSAQFYGDDELEYPADSTGTWKIKLDMFPGWDTSKWPDNYYLYGSGVYELEISVGGSAIAPRAPAPQPEIIPVAQTFIVNDDPNSNNDEYGYISAIPAANYIENGERYVSPIVYQGVDKITNWFGTVDDTSQYLLDDWNFYLDRHGIIAEEFIIPPDPVEAAASIATSKWTSSNTAVLAVDGSGFEDEIISIINKEDSLSSSPNIVTIQPGELKEINALSVKPMYLGSQWGAIHLIGKGDDFSGDTGIITPHYEGLMEDWWPYPYDSNGEDRDTYYPIFKPGIWMPYVTSESGLDELQIIKYPGNRYNIPIDSSDSSIEVTIETDNPSTLIIYLIDPEGYIRRPSIPHWNGGEINPIHYWNGGHWEHDQDEFRTWKLEPHADYSVNVHNAMEGTWTVIVVPYLDPEEGDVGFNGNYHINANIRKYNDSRVNAAISAANAAVIASTKHVPLLYVTENSIPSETTNALTQLGTSNIIFVNIGEVSSASPSGSVTEYTTMQQVINSIKDDPNSENYITVTSLGTGDGYFAPSSMIAAYHVSPVINIAEAKIAYNTLDQMSTWEEYMGDYYHGCRSVGHLPSMLEPIDIENPPSLIDLILYYFKNDKTFPPFGLDLKLQLFSQTYNDIYDLINNYGLDKNGKEVYLFVSPRDTDIRGYVCRTILGNNSYSGHIPVETAAFSSDIICRSILYPAIIYANPGRDVISSCLMNYRNGHTWKCNDMVEYMDYISQLLKESGFSRGRFYEGHTLWSNLLERYNEGVGLIYHCSHGTGGSGVCCMYENVEEQFPLAEPSRENRKSFTWWDGWRGYYYDDMQMKSPRYGGLVWFNAEEPNLYDIVHFKYLDQDFDNLHSQFNLWQSCTTGKHFGPIIYLEHGAVLAYSNANTGRSPQTEIIDSWIMEDMMKYGVSLGEAQSDYYWMFERDYTTLDPTTLYGPSSMDCGADNLGDCDGLANIPVVFGDPTLTLYTPEWNEPTPVSP